MNREKKQRLYLLVTAALLLLLPLTVFVSQKVAVLFTRAAGLTPVEVENGTISGNILVGADSNASGGKFIQFATTSTGVTPIPTVQNNPTAVPVNPSTIPVNPTSIPQQPPNSGFQPTSPYYGTFYYMWYQNPNTDSSWSYWTDRNNNPPNTWFSHYLPDSNVAQFNPATELYSSGNYGNFKWQVAKMAEAKQEVAIASWWGQSRKEDAAFNKIINDFMSRADNPYPNLRWAVYYEDEGFNDPQVSEIVTNLNYIKQKYSQSPYMLKVDGKPVVFVYAGANDVPGTMTSRWKQANQQVGNAFYINLKVFGGFASDPNQPNSWHQYAPAVRSGSFNPYSSFVSPGFWLDGDPERLSRNSNEFELAVKGMVSSSTMWKLVETWNEWGEGTSVEPGNAVKLNTATGKEEIDPSGYPFGNLYIDILNRNLPSLERGTGSGNNPQPPTSTNIPVQSSIAPAVLPTSSGNAGKDPVVAVSGDMVCGAASTGAACKQMQTSDLIVAMNPTAVLALGDVQYEQGALSDFQIYYEPSWGRFKNITYPTVGNHEYLTSGASGYYDYFNGVGVQTGRAGDRSKGYYAVNVGNWRIYILNTNCSQAGGCGVGSAQEKWLRADLAANPRACSIATVHHPLWTSGSRANEGGDKTPLYKAFYDARGEIILAGHEHNYERFAPQTANGLLDPSNGVVEFVVGTGGRNFTQFVTTATNSLVRDDKTFGVLKLVLHPNSYDFEFVPIAGSTFTDRGTNISCH